MHDLPPAPLGLSQAILLHLAPCAAIDVFYGRVAPHLGRAGAPPFLAIVLAIPLVLVSLEPGILLRRGR